MYKAIWTPCRAHRVFPGAASRMYLANVHLCTQPQQSPSLCIRGVQRLSTDTLSSEGYITQKTKAVVSMMRNIGFTGL